MDTCSLERKKMTDLAITSTLRISTWERILKGKGIDLFFLLYTYARTNTQTYIHLYAQINLSTYC